jgi:hypothetical protein
MVSTDVWREAGRPRWGGRPAEESESPYEQRSAVMGVEQRGTGRWIRERQTVGSRTGVSAREG